MSPDRPSPQPEQTLYIGDVHGDPEMLEKSLEEAEKQGWNGENLICTGDVVDRGHDSRGALDILESRKARILMGNHDACALLNAQQPQHAELDHWLGMGGYSVLIELAFRTRDRARDLLESRMPPVPPLGKDERVVIGKMAKEYGLKRAPLLEAFLTWQRLVLHGKYKKIFDAMQLCSLDAGILAVHAGIDDTWAAIIEEKGIDGMPSSGRCLRWRSGGRSSG